MTLPKESSHTPHGSNDKRDEHVRAVLRALRVIFRTTQAHSRWVEKKCGVSGPQLWAMWELHAQPGLRVSELSASLSIHQSTASNMLDKLEQKGFIRRERGGPDQRVVRLYLTDAGSDVLKQAPRPAQGAITHALQELPDEALEALHASLDSLVSTMSIADLEAAMHPISASEK